MKMEFRLTDSTANLSLSSSSHLSSCSSSVLFRPRRCGEKRREEVRLISVSSHKPSKAKKSHKEDSNRRLSHILRTEAAVLRVEKKAVSFKYRTLWPKAVLEALDDAMAGDRWESALKIFGLLRRQHWYNPKSQTYARLLTMLGRCKQPKYASWLFHIMLSEGLKPTIDVYTSLLGAYGYSGLLDEAYQIIDDMKSVYDCKPDVYTYAILIRCCSKVRRFDLIRKVVTEMSYFGIKCNIVIYNTLVDGFGKAGMLEDMEDCVSNMLENGNCVPDIFTLNSIIWAYGNSGQLDKMEKWYDEFQQMGVEPDVKTFNILIRSYGKAGMTGKMSLVMDFMKKRCFSPTTVTYNLLLECFGNVGNIGKMEAIFQNMKFLGIKPNSVTYSSLVNAYSKVGLLDKVSMIMRQVDNSGVVLDTTFFNCVISAYGHAGHVETMKEMFSLMRERNCKPDTITFSTMIHAYTCLGMTEAAQELETIMHQLNDKKLESNTHESTMDSFQPQTVKIYLPVRIDFVGGWSDTPPWSLERPGCVLNMAINLDGYPPVFALIETTKTLGILIYDDFNNQLYIEDPALIRGPFEDSDPFRLVKSALIVTSAIHGRLLIGGGLCIKTSANVPRGSGLGTSSILAAAVVKGLLRLMRQDDSSENVARVVLVLEQIMGTGGGWQDQIGGLYPGIKCTSSFPGQPLQLQVGTLLASQELVHELEQHLLVVFTGQVLLAHQVLQKVVTRYLRRDNLLTASIKRLAKLAKVGREAMMNGDIDELGAIMLETWRLHQELDPFCSNEFVDKLFKFEEKLLAKDGDSALELRRLLDASSEFNVKVYNWNICLKDFNS